MTLAHLPRRASALSSIALVGLAAACTSCSSSTAPASSGETEFVAYATSFSNFDTWSKAAAVAEANDAGDGLHVGPLQVYWNQSPPHGSTSFPVGTIIVKESEETDPTQRVVFAMVKRGGGFNSGGGGANGWEWFSLQDNGDGTVTILWRGIVAPAGQLYAGQPIGDCNGCHTLAAHNDDVWDEALELSKF